MKLLGLTFLTVCFFEDAHSFLCTSSFKKCIDKTHYQFCTGIFGLELYLGQIYECPTGTYCVESFFNHCDPVFIPNINMTFPPIFFPTTPTTPTTTTTVPTTTTTIPTTTTTKGAAPEEPACSGSGRHPAANCSQYWECTPWLFFWFSPSLQDCPAGQIFPWRNGENNICVNGTVDDCTW